MALLATALIASAILAGQRIFAKFSDLLFVLLNHMVVDVFMTGPDSAVDISPR